MLLIIYILIVNYHGWSVLCEGGRPFGWYLQFALHTRLVCSVRMHFCWWEQRPPQNGTQKRHAQTGLEWFPTRLHRKCHGRSYRGVWKRLDQLHSVRSSKRGHRSQTQGFSISSPWGQSVKILQLFLSWPRASWRNDKAWRREATMTLSKTAHSGDSY